MMQILEVTKRMTGQSIINPQASLALRSLEYPIRYFERRDERESDLVSDRFD